MGAGRSRVPVVLLALPLGGLAFAVLEHAFPLRPRRAPFLRRAFVNLALGTAGSGVTLLVVLALRRTPSIPSPFAALPPLLRCSLALLALDYELYAWHRMNHRSPFLFSFHAVHHLDPDLDVTTAARFHVGELLLSVPTHLAILSAFGLRSGEKAALAALVALATTFHHANLRLPVELDRALAKVIVTPRLHGVHHSKAPQEFHANFATIFSFWDRLGGSFRYAPAPSAPIGVAGQGAEPAFELGASLAFPFRARLRLVPPRSDEEVDS
jgi:sterol desaturase/sphingolipid hydroxylase (fatty acid hydroxylase superfamily)